MDNKTFLEKFKAVFNKETVEINLATETLGDGQATLEAESFEAGQPVMIVDGDQRVPLPVGEYPLDNGMTLIVVEEGIIDSMVEATPEGEEEVAEEPVAQADAPNATPPAKSIIESIVKETKFQAQEKEITELKAQIAELMKVEEVIELKDESIKFNPENKAEFKMNLGKNIKGDSISKNVMSKIANLK